jgi:N-succinyl-L-ornithine transcarbamylase
MKNFYSIKDVENLDQLVQEALEIKKNPNKYSYLGKNKSICLLFFNPSLRTRLSTQKAAFNLGMDVSVMDIGEEGWKLEFADGVIMDGEKAEHVKEAAAVIGAYYDVIGIRSFPSLENRDEDYNDLVLKSFIKYSGKPVINLESAVLHPCQSFADLITIEELKKKDRPKVVLTWAPHPKRLPQAVPNSFAEWMNIADVDLVITHPAGYELAEEFRGSAKIEYDQDKAFEGADFIYAKNWSSYTDYGQIISKDTSWTVTAEKMKLTNQAKFMHCLPVRRNMIVSDEVLDSDSSVVIAEAYNRIISVQTVLKRILENI